MTSELGAGLVVGALIAVPLAFVLAHSPARRAGPAPVGGLAVVVGTLVTLAARRSVPFELVVGVVGVGAICAVGPRRLGVTIATAIALPFAWLMTVDLDLPVGGVRVLLAVTAAAGAVAITRTDEEWHSTALTPLLLAISAAAIFLAVPDTEEAGALLGVALPVAVLGRPLGLVSLGRAGAGAVTVLVVWTVGTGGRAAEGSMIAGCACLVLLVGLSVGLWFTTVDDSLARREVVVRSLPAVVIVHGALALFASRAGGGSASLGIAALVSLLTTVASVAAGTVLRPPTEGASPGHW